MTIFIGISVCFLIFSLISFVFSMVTYIKLEALKQSTHSVQFMPAENALTENKPQPQEPVVWGHTDDEIKKINEINKDGDEEDYVL